MSDKITCMHPVSLSNVHSNIDIDSNNSYSIGNIVCISIRFSTSGNVNAYNVLFKVPAMKHANLGSDSVNGIITVQKQNETIQGYTNGKGEVYLYNQLISGNTYFMNFTYAM